MTATVQHALWSFCHKELSSWGRKEYYYAYKGLPKNFRRAEAVKHELSLPLRVTNLCLA